MCKVVGEFNKITYEQFYKDMDEEFDVDEVFVKRIYNEIEIPTRATDDSAGYDIHSPIRVILKPDQEFKIPTGINVQINNGWFLAIVPRSGSGFKGINLMNNVGIIDKDYITSDNEGHIWVKLVNRGSKTMIFEEGDGIAQGIFLNFGITVDDDRTPKQKRNGGFGSTN